VRKEIQWSKWRLKTILPGNFVVIWAIRWQFIGIDIFKNLKVFAIFMEYNGFDIQFVLLWFLQGSIDFIEG
jgi:hypothetical protein